LRAAQGSASGLPLLGEHHLLGVSVVVADHLKGRIAVLAGYRLLLLLLQAEQREAGLQGHLVHLVQWDDALGIVLAV